MLISAVFERANLKIISLTASGISWNEAKKLE